jgi:hypothetical protein
LRSNTEVVSLASKKIVVFFRRTMRKTSIAE